MARWKPFKKLLKSLRAIGPGAASPPRAAPKQRPKPFQMFKQHLRAYEIASVIDVGANSGQFVENLRSSLLFSGKVISIEPLPDAFAALARRTAADPNWSALNLALGEAEGVLPINIAGNSASSSILPMLPRHETAAPNSRYKGQVAVRVARLDSVPELIAATSVNCMLKIDTQGYELAVIRGAENVLDRFSLVFLEVSLVPLYENGPLIEEVISYLRRKGFDPIGIYPGYTERWSVHQLQANMLFANSARMSALLAKGPTGRLK